MKDTKGWSKIDAKTPREVVNLCIIHRLKSCGSQQIFNSKISERLPIKKDFSG
jgi:hypothetical protein